MFKIFEKFKTKEKIKGKFEDVLFYCMLSGILLLSAGIGIIGLNAGDLGVLLIAIGSLLLFFGAVTLVFVLD